MATTIPGTALGGGGLAVAMLAIGLVAESRGVEPDRQAAARVRAVQKAMGQVRPLHTKKTPPARGEWLAEHDEPGQTFAQYVKSDPNRPNRTHTTIYIQPLGEFTAGQMRVIDATIDYLARFYQTPIKRLPAIGIDEIPADAQRTHPTWGDRQILTTYVLKTLLPPRLPDDAVAMLALTGSDLWPGEGWNFVFGQASLRDRVGVWSLYRNGDADGEEAEARQCLVRTIKTAEHELGHMLGMKHCTAYECAMNGSNHQTESDSRPLAFCPECAGKVWWACGASPKKQLASLIEFAEEHKLAAESEFWRQSLNSLSR